ncbi:unnamed protein product [Ilex paraguariensis]|uniref:GHMP kinase N-terminal domain-containing protein n=1 Tax=Ilex paraguariensis TaxID=185542 RepID=A0ABC8TMK0_9AQUA
MELPLEEGFEFNNTVTVGRLSTRNNTVFQHKKQKLSMPDSESFLNTEVDEIQIPRHIAKSNDKILSNDAAKARDECNWGSYARGALYALQSSGHRLTKGIIGSICGSEGLDSSGLSSSAAVGVAYLLALESANNLTVSPTKNIEYDR